MYYIVLCLIYRFSIMRDSHKFSVFAHLQYAPLFAFTCVVIHSCGHTVYTFKLVWMPVCVCVCGKQSCVMGAPSSPGHSWLCLDCLSWAVLWSMQGDKETHTGKYTLNMSINMSGNLAQSLKLLVTLPQVGAP